MVVDHVPLLEFIPVTQPPVFDPSGDRIASVVGSTHEPTPQCVIVDGLAQRSCGFSPDGGRYAYVTLAKRALRGDRWRCVVDGIPGSEFDAIESYPMFSSKGDRLAYVARRGEWFAVVDESPERSFVRAFRPTFSTADRFAYLGFDSRESVSVIVDGREVRPPLLRALRAPCAGSTPSRTPRSRRRPRACPSRSPRRRRRHPRARGR